MLRPSRPMIRPFMSSDGSSTSVTVVSAAWLAATRWSASATRLRARRFASVCASSSSWRTRRASSWRTSSSERSSSCAFASLTRHARRSARAPSSCALLRLLQLLLELRVCTSRSATPCSRRSSSPQRAARARPPSRADALLDLRRARVAPLVTSLSISARSWTASSRASICASRRSASASRSRLGDQQLARAARGRDARSRASAWTASTAAAAPATRPISDPDDDRACAAPLVGCPRLALPRPSRRHHGRKARRSNRRSAGRARSRRAV